MNDPSCKEILVGWMVVGQSLKTTAIQAINASNQSSAVNLINGYIE